MAVYRLIIKGTEGNARAAICSNLPHAEIISQFTALDGDEQAVDVEHWNEEMLKARIEHWYAESPEVAPFPVGSLMLYASHGPVGTYRG